jgi:hypothetical protein
MSPWRTINGRHVFIGGRRRKGNLPKVSHQQINSQHIQRMQEQNRLERKITKNALSAVLNQAPLISELHTCYLLADTVFSNLDLITKTYDSYQKYGLNGVTEILGIEIVKNTLSDIQTEIAWHAISKFVPPMIQEQGKEVLSNIIDKVTSAEVSFVKNFLIEEKKDAHSHMTGHTKYLAYPCHYSNKQPKMPDDVKFV